MALITDPDDLNQATEIIFDTSMLTIQLLVAGNLSNDGVDLKCVYSFSREEWKSDASLVKYPFPILPIDGPSGTQFNLISGWTWKDATTTGLIRGGGWAVKDSGGLSKEEWMNVTGLGGFKESTDQAYYTQGDLANPTDILNAGLVNQAIKIYGDASNGNFDYRDNFNIFLREEAKSYEYYDLITAQNITALTYKKYAVPLENSTDLKVTHTDAEVETTPYTSIDITYHSPSVARTVASVSRDFDKIIEGDNKTLEQIYEKIMYLQRQSTDIDEGSGTVRGDTSDLISWFIGDTLHIKGYIDNLSASYSNRVVFYDDNGIARVPTILNAFDFSISPSIIGYEWRLYYVTAVGSLVGAVEQDGEETATSDSQSFSYTYSSDQAIAVQIITQPNSDYIENISYYTISNSNQSVIINLMKDDNN